MGGRSFYYELLLDRPELVPRLASLFAASNYLSSLLASHPRLIEPLFADPNVLVLTRAELRGDLDALLEQCCEGADDVEGELCAMRLFCHRHISNVGLLDIGERIQREQAELALTEIAEVCLEQALRFGEARLRGRRPELSQGAIRFLVVGMGKLASRELTYGSDLDLIFLFDAPDSALLDAQEYCTRLAQRLISSLQTHTSEGLCYEVDSRLRPSGNQGSLVSSLASFERYHQSGAQSWERQALLRARPLAGDPELASAFAQLRLQILSRPAPQDLAGELHHVRTRMETEIARETRRRHDFKLGRGGLLDVETGVQYLQLSQAEDSGELLEVMRTEQSLDRLVEGGLLSVVARGVLGSGWDFLQRLSSRLRIVENRSMSDLDEERGDLDGLARRLGYVSEGRDSGARRALLADYRRHTDAIRQVYREILGAEVAD